MSEGLIILQAELMTIAKTENSSEFLIVHCMFSLVVASNFAHTNRVH